MDIILVILVLLIVILLILNKNNVISDDTLYLCGHSALSFILVIIMMLVLILALGQDKENLERYLILHENISNVDTNYKLIVNYDFPLSYSKYFDTNNIILFNDKASALEYIDNISNVKYIRYEFNDYSFEETTNTTQSQNE